MIRIAIIEASHWHVPLYLDGFDAADVRVVALSDSSGSDSSGSDSSGSDSSGSDSSGTAGLEISSRFGARAYSDVDELIKCEEIDFAFAFGRHCEMTAIALALIEAGIPFSLEKPCGMCVQDIERLLAASVKAGIYVAVPYVQRFGQLENIIADLEGGLPSDFTHLSVRFIAGAPQRYEKWNCAWMLDPSQSGGGALMNLGGHFVDMFRRLTGGNVVRVSAMMSSATHGRDVEDFAVVMLQGSNGATGVIETGYTYPDDAPEQREFSLTARSAMHYLRTADNGLLVRPVDTAAGTARIIPFENETDLYYPIYARRVLDEWRNNRAPSIGLADAVEVMKVLAAAYESARRGGKVQTVT